MTNDVQKAKAVVEYLEEQLEVAKAELGLLEKSSTPKRKASVFKKPTLEEITSYAKETGRYIDAETFYDFYECKGWMVGKNKMKCWKSAVRTWLRRDNTPRNMTAQEGIFL